MIDDLNRIITAELHRYLHLPKRTTKKEKQEMYNQIYNHVREMVYFMPQEYGELAEEDCAAFMIFFDNKINGVINAYREDLGDFGAYVYPIIKMNTRSYKSENNKKNSREQSILMGYSSYEFLLKESEYRIEDAVLSDVSFPFDTREYKIMCKLKHIFNRVPKTRERFYVYFASHSVYMSANKIYYLCQFFNFNYDETSKIINYLTESNRHREKALNNAIEKRNEYFSRQLYLENELVKVRYNEDEAKYDELCEKINRVKSLSESKAKFIETQLRRIPRSTLAILFNKQDSTIGSYLVVSQNLVAWCHNQSNILIPTYQNYGINARVMEEIRGFWDNDLEGITLQELFPIKCFHINITLNS